MPNQCPHCSKINPADAYYCYYDGRPLSKDRQQGPIHVGSMPFPTAFHFSDGQACVNFNQLALACNDRWEEARGLLSEGIWPTFFKGIGRLDLAAVAKQAAGEPDLDRGLSQLLEKLPADPDSLRPPKLALESTEENLGQLTPGADLSFEVVLFNQGMFLLHGMASSNNDWLVFGDRAGPTHKMFQTRNTYAIPMRVIGSKLRAGLKPLQGEIVIDTNGGAVTVPVRADVPIRPFPKGSGGNALAGAMTPGDIARKAKEHPNEAAILFEQGAVKDWYVSNGWTYPVEGSAGSGKGAVQQFFEALGLTKPPRLEIDYDTLIIKGKVGEHQSRLVTISTEEAKPVYAQAWSNKNWVTCGPMKYQGKKVKIDVEVVIPPNPGETVRAQVTFRGNGKQQFVVPVIVTVEKGSAAVAKKTTGLNKTRLAVLQDESDLVQTTTAWWWLSWVGWFAGSFLVTIVALVLFAIFVLKRTF